MAITHKKILKIVAIPFVLLLGIELLLQLGALIVAATGRDVPTGWSTRNTHVLALGDSNTFGLYLDEDESYPSQLEKLWNDLHPDKLIEVLNLGYPGTNSFRVANTIEEVIKTFKPDMVLLTVGVNDIYTASEFIEANPKAGDDSSIWDPLTLLRRHSRLYKLVYMAKQGIKESHKTVTSSDHQATESGSPSAKKRDLLKWSNDADERMRGIMEFKMANGQKTTDSSKLTEAITYGGKTFVMISAEENSHHSDKEKGFHHIQHNLASIQRRVEQSGAKFYLLTYAASAGIYARTNVEIKNYAATHHGVGFIDVATDIKTECPLSPECPDLFFQDLHPTAKGYERVANIVVKTFNRDAVY